MLLEPGSGEDSSAASMMVTLMLSSVSSTVWNSVKMASSSNGRPRERASATPAEGIALMQKAQNCIAYKHIHAHRQSDTYRETVRYTHRHTGKEGVRINIMDMGDSKERI